MTANTDPPWWQHGVIYQIYPRSYQDSTGTGVGDLAGITSRLDHLQWLGVDCVWLSPIYPSPMEDGGYDVADYTDVDPTFGTLTEVDALIAQAHARDLRVVLDLVPNHTSHRHPWFVESRSARDAARRDWYIWRDPGPDGGPPSNWRSVSHEQPGSAWHLDEATGQYYLATFSPVQPDLNWANARVRAAIADVMRFWLDRGVDGFRIDMATFLAKDPEYCNEPLVTPGEPINYVRDARHHFNRPETLEYLSELRSVVDAYDDRVLVGEMLYESPIEVLVEYARDAGIDLPANFGLITLPFDADAIAEHVDVYDRATSDAGVWPNYCLSNHDMPRPSRLGPQGARLAIMVLLTLRGTPFLYYGDEIGMANVEVPPDRADDPWSVSIGGVTRDSVRTPMQWDAGPNAGFCPADVEPWLPLCADRERVNVAVQRGDPSSSLQLTRRLLELRRRTPALTIGTYQSCTDMAPPGCLAFLRAHDDQRRLVLANISDEPCTVDLARHRGADLVLHTGAVVLDGATAHLGAWAAAVVAVA
jgi:alpha-glucosidase